MLYLPDIKAYQKEISELKSINAKLCSIADCNQPSATILCPDHCGKGKNCFELSYDIHWYSLHFSTSNKRIMRNLHNPSRFGQK